MQKGSEIIANLFSKKFEKFQVQTSNEEWARLNSKLNRLNFVKFSFATFNIYYLIVIVGLAGTVTYSSISYINLSKKLKSLEKEIGTDITYKNETPSLPHATNGAKDVIKRLDQEKEKKADSDFNHGDNKQVKPEKSKKIENSEINKESFKEVVAPPIQTDTLKPPIKRVKKIISIKPTQVVIKDTVIIIK